MTTRRNFLKQSLLAAGATAIPASSLLAQEKKEEEMPKYRLPYKNTYLKEPLVTENEYRIAAPETTVPGSFAEAKKILPEPVWEGHAKELEMYWKAWEIGVRNIKAPEAGSGFVSSYIDTAYNGNIFMWDSAFITMFARYGTRFFPFQRTLDNFYAKQHPDGFICREIKSDGADCFERYDPTSTGPNILPWSEIIYYKQFGDMDRLHRIFPVLCAYYKWLKLNHTWRNGTYWSSGWGTGMDNMPRVQPQYNMIYSHGHMIWLDATLQQYFIAGILLEIGFYLERWQEIEDFEDEQKLLKTYINENLWDDKEKCLFDQYRDGSLSSTKGIYAYWALLTDVLPKDRLDAFVAELDNKETFNRPHRIPSLAANNEKYKANGRYWQGGVWPGATYMVLTGLVEKGYRKMAYDIATNHYNNVFGVYKKTGTFWEYYAPETMEPGFMARPDFIGWTGLPPIAVLIEHIFGIRSNVYDKKMTIDVNLTEAYGIKRYPFGMDGLVDIKVKARSAATQEPQVEITSNVPFELTVLWGDKQKVVNIKTGTQTV
ncbi:MGH1-like glycoside hydrolase domain-containing protein [Parabacteroides bouchesdurhonensis]|uniref:MGH1-like glycoside hydrolase domain-containing protein n=1 Tax=Parabacteroides bouchesdurhonensis TaxID=1936995 RepID=UPI000E4E754A|nr:trehalase family glycosidase [Parabacteroides bouchesdurhonensis]RHJ92111.1 glycoside hydrolase [Bacteroides sp. AM07-16]